MRSPAELYDWELAHVAVDRARRLDLPFYAELAARTDGTVLELACGTGRLTADLGAVGLDIDPAMLAVARRRGVERLVCADMRRFRLAGRFGLVAVPYNSLQLLGSDGEMVACLRVAAEHVAPGGLLAVEVGDFQAGATRDSVDPELLADADGVRLYGALVHDRAGRTTIYHRRFEQGRAVHVDHVRLRCLDRAELEELFRQAGLCLVEARQDGHRLFAAGAPEPARLNGH